MDIDLIHDFVLCDLAECPDDPAHCGYVWCGAPRNHPLHTCWHFKTEGAEKGTDNE